MEISIKDCMDAGEKKRARTEEVEDGKVDSPAARSGDSSGCATDASKPSCDSDRDVKDAQKGIIGTHVCTLVLQSGSSNRGIAVSPDGDVFAVSNSWTHSFTVYKLGDGAVLAEFGGYGSELGRFNIPAQLCFTPRGRNLLIVDSANNRVQEMTLAGAHVRLIGAAVIDCKALSVAASGERIAVGTSRDTNQVFVFALDSGALLYTFGPKGLGEGQLCRSRSMRFTPDGAHIIIAENFNYRLSVFKMCGEFVRWIGVDSLEWPNDVDFAPNGDILVADHDHDRVCMFSSDGSTLIRTFGSEGAGPGEFIYPIGLALHSGLLYVLDEGTARVQVFS